jgi:LysM repeat protein
MTDAVYGSKVTGPRYKIDDYAIKPGETLSEILGGNQLAIEYVIRANDLDIANLKPGTRIRIPVRDQNGSTLPELIDQLKE